MRDTPYFGAVCGRFCNRIANGKFSLDGQQYTLAPNNEPGGIKCSLHGGLKGYDKVVWRGEALVNGVEMVSLAGAGRLFREVHGGDVEGAGIVAGFGPLDLTG